MRLYFVTSHASPQLSFQILDWTSTCPNLTNLQLKIADAQTLLRGRSGFSSHEMFLNSNRCNETRTTNEWNAAPRTSSIPCCSTNVKQVWRFVLDFSMFKALEVSRMRAVLDAARGALASRADRFFPSPIVPALYASFSPGECHVSYNGRSENVKYFRNWAGYPLGTGSIRICFTPPSQSRGIPEGK